MGDDSCLKGRGFETWCHILDGHLIFFENCIVCLIRPKINEKEAGICPYLKKTNKQIRLSAQICPIQSLPNTTLRLLVKGF